MIIEHHMYSMYAMLFLFQYHAFVVFVVRNQMLPISRYCICVF